MRAAAKAVLLSRGPSPVGLDDVTYVVLRIMGALRLVAMDHHDCAQVILAVCREIGIVGAGWRVFATSQRLLNEALPNFQIAAE